MNSLADVRAACNGVRLAGFVVIIDDVILRSVGEGTLSLITPVTTGFAIMGWTRTRSSSSAWPYRAMTSSMACVSTLPSFAGTLSPDKSARARTRMRNPPRLHDERTASSWPGLNCFADILQHLLPDHPAILWTVKRNAHPEYANPHGRQDERIGLGGEGKELSSINYFVFISQ